MYTEAAAVPSRRHLSIGGPLFDTSGVVKRGEQKTFAVKSSCKVASEKVTSSASSTAKATSKATSVKVSTVASTKTVTKTVSATATVTSSAKASEKTSAIVLTSNNASYGETELTSDLTRILKWAQDEDNVTSAEKKEIVAALLSASARYYPELPTQVICRIMLADIRAESDFNPREISGGRLDSGSSWGLLQVSPNGASQELNLFQDHGHVLTHNFTYGMPASTRAGIRGPLLDYDTGKTLVLSDLTRDDLFRPWINIHLAMWTQSNLARTSSQDPYNWAALNDYSWSMKVQTLNGTSARISNKWQTLLKGASLPTTIKTGLGSWVAGPATNGEGSYTQTGDDISNQYLNNIMTAVRYLYGVTDKSKMPKSWLDTYTLNPGLVDYRTY